VDEDDTCYESSVLCEAQRLIGVLSDLVNTHELEGIIGTDIESVDRHVLILKNAALLDDLIFFKGIESSLSESTKEELMLIAIRKDELVSVYESAESTN